MPIYAYRCEACGRTLERLQRIADAPLVDCPACGAPKLIKMVTAAGFQLKGAGWYATDFRGSGTRPADAAANADAPKPETGKPEAGKSDTGKSEAAKSEAAPPAGGCGGGCACAAARAANQ